jgi:hypothetical protein
MASRTEDLRDRIVVLARNDYNRARSEAPQLLADPFTTVIAVPLRPPHSEDPTLQAMSCALQPSAVLIRNRWGANAYVDATAVHEKLSLAKFNAFANVCQMLGATRLEVEELREVTEDGSVSSRVDFHVGKMQSQLTAGSEWFRRLAQSIKGQWTWRSGRCDTDLAARYAEQLGLLADPVISGLIQQRQFTGNALTEQLVELDVSSDAQREIRATLGMEASLLRLAPAFEATFASLRHQSHHLGLRVRVAFDSQGPDCESGLR